MMEDVEASPASKKSSGHLHIGKLTGCSCNFAPRNQWNLPNILAYISGIFDDFFKAGLVPLIKLFTHAVPSPCLWE